MRLLFATGNRGKLTELTALVRGLPIEIESLQGVPALEIDEDGATFEENALKKARAYADTYGVAALADDSGLCVDALGGAPGIRSARFSPSGRDADNNALLLERLADLPPARRGAAFHCALALIVPGGPPEIMMGICPGRIIEAPRGAHGFGYDPLFVPDGFASTMAQLDPEQKNRISHRARAFGLLRPRLEACSLKVARQP